MAKRAALVLAVAVPLGLALVLQFDGAAIESSREAIYRTIGALPESARLVLVGAVLMAVTSALRTAAAPLSQIGARSPVRVLHKSVPIVQPGSPTQDAAA